jgi:transposase-like protein
MSEEVELYIAPVDVLIEQLTPKQRRFVNMYLTGQYNKAQLAQLLDVDANTIYSWMRNGVVKEVVRAQQEELQETSKNEIKSLASSAIQTMRELLSSPIDGIRFQAAKDVLDRNNLKGENKVIVNKTVTTIEQKLSSLIDDTMGDIIDIELEGD